MHMHMHMYMLHVHAACACTCTCIQMHHMFLSARSGLRRFVSACAWCDVHTCGTSLLKYSVICTYRVYSDVVHTIRRPASCNIPQSIIMLSGREPCYLSLPSCLSKMSRRIYLLRMTTLPRAPLRCKEVPPHSSFAADGVRNESRTMQVSQP
jgi:hypothetical protein